MGNNASSEGGRTGRPFSRATGALGLSRPELEERCKPSGLYPSWQWDDRTIRRLIGDGKLAARQKGADTRLQSTMHECPICFLHYSQVNTTLCCQAELCTECYLQVRPQKEKQTACPFCNSTKLVTKVAKTMDTAAVQERQLDEQKVIEAKIRARASSGDSEERGFGSNLEQNTAVRLMRARSESLSSSDVDGDDVASIVAMTPEDRHVLEEEIRAQHTHPLARQVEQEADDRRLQNERNYYRSQSGRIRELRAAELRARSARMMARMSSDSTLLAGNRRASRNWNEIVEAFEQNGNGSVNTLDDLVVLEAAILLSMAEEDRRREHDGGTTGAAASNESPSFDASEHARRGFPLARNVASGARHSSSRRSASLRALHQHGANEMSNLLLRGISEAEQIEMAIAASLQQSQQQQEAASNDETNENQQDDGPQPNAALQSSNDPRAEETAASEHGVQNEVSISDNTSTSSEVGSTNAPNDNVSGEMSSRSDDTSSSACSSIVESINNERPATDDRVEAAVESGNISNARANSEASATEQEAASVSTGESAAVGGGANTERDECCAEGDESLEERKEPTVTN